MQCVVLPFFALRSKKDNHRSVKLLTTSYLLRVQRHREFPPSLFKWLSIPYERTIQSQYSALSFDYVCMLILPDVVHAVLRNRSDRHSWLFNSVDYCGANNTMIAGLMPVWELSCLRQGVKWGPLQLYFSMILIHSFCGNIFDFCVPCVPKPRLLCVSLTAE